MTKMLELNWSFFKGKNIGLMHHPFFKQGLLTQPTKRARLETLP